MNRELVVMINRDNNNNNKDLSSSYNNNIDLNKGLKTIHLYHYEQKLRIYPFNLIYFVL